jgi:uncharacterized damage-inducible protein DinB
MANYNQWTNEKVYRSAAFLSAEEIAANRGAFFGSILGTLNHILVADTIWLKRFSQAPFLQKYEQTKALNDISRRENPASLDTILFSDFTELTEQRCVMDKAIIDFINELTEETITLPLAYINTKGVAFNKPFNFLLHHFFNHQTHHRGHTTTLLSQQGIDVGATDLMLLIPDAK